MEWGSSPEEHDSVQMLEKPTTFPSFLGRRSFVPRPLSDATDFFDLDNSSDADFTPQSLGSSRSTASTEELMTPQTGGLGGFEFHFDDKPVEGPVGPHLFRLSPDSLAFDEDQVRLPSNNSTKVSRVKRQNSQSQLPSLELDEDEEDKQSRRSFTAELLVDRSDPPKTPGRPVTALNKAVAELDETQVRTWTPRQVASWMAEAGFEPSVVEKFLIHDISGIVLLDLQFEDLKELDISSFGKRHRVMSSIQHLRNSSLISMDTPLERSPSKQSPVQRTPRTLQRNVLPEDCHVIAESRSRSRRRQRHRDGHEVVSPNESVSIVAIEQLLPKPHNCSKGEDCPKWQKQQRKLQRIQHEFAAEAHRALAAEQEAAEAALRPVSENVPSLIGSSDVLGPTPPFKITAERLSEVQMRDPQESIKQFLSFQHLAENQVHGPSPPPAASASFVPKQTLSTHLRGLPKLTIPLEAKDDESPSRTPIPELLNLTSQQVKAKAQLKADPYHYGGVASPADVYRIDTPFSAADVPLTQYPLDPLADQRGVSQSVPPELRYGAPLTTINGDPVPRSASAQASHPRRRLTKQSFAPSVTPVKEDFPSSPHYDAHRRPSAPAHQSSDILNHAGWMRKRRTTKLLRHEWSDNYFSLDGTRLLMFADDVPESRQLEAIDVDDYAIHAYSVDTSRKLSAAFKKSILGAGYVPSSQPSYAFSLIPETEGNRRLFEKSKSHHFALHSGGAKVEWMRRLMLAKAVSRNGNGHHEI